MSIYVVVFTHTLIAQNKNYLKYIYSHTICSPGNNSLL